MLLILCFLLLGCNVKEEELTIGMIPLRSEEKLVDDFEPIRRYLEEQLNIPIKFVVTDNYATLVEEMKNETIDIGWFGAFSYVAADSQLDLTPLVLLERKEEGIYYQSLIITHIDTNIHTIEDIKDTTFAFVDAGSTSGFILPYALLKSRDIDYKQYFREFHYSGSHEEVAIDVKNKHVDAGAISSTQYNKLIKTGEIDVNDFRVIWKSEDIPGSLFVAKNTLDKKLQDEFISASKSIHDAQPKALKRFDDSIEKYIEVDKNIYHSIRNISTILGKDELVEYFFNNK